MKIGFVGLGNVGGKLAGSLLRNGKDLTVLDLNPELVDGFVSRGAKAADSPAASDARLRRGDHLPSVARCLQRGGQRDVGRGMRRQDLA